MGGLGGGCRGRRVGCGPAGTRRGLTQALCSGHMAFVISHWERDSSLTLLPPPPPSSSHLSLSDFPSLSLSLLLSGFKGLKCFSCLLCIKCPPPHLPPPATLNFAVLREKWLSGGEAADAVKPSQTEAGVITGRCSLLIPCEEVNGAGVAEKVLPAPTEQLILYNGPQFGCDYDTFWW